MRLSRARGTCWWWLGDRNDEKPFHNLLVTATSQKAAKTQRWCPNCTVTTPRNRNRAAKAQSFSSRFRFASLWIVACLPRLRQRRRQALSRCPRHIRTVPTQRET